MAFRKMAMSGSAASLFVGAIFHSACNFNMSRSNIFYDEDWQSAMVLIVDETFFIRDKENQKMDMNLRK